VSKGIGRERIGDVWKHVYTHHTGRAAPSTARGTVLRARSRSIPHTMWIGQPASAPGTLPVGEGTDGRPPWPEGCRRRRAGLSQATTRRQQRRVPAWCATWSDGRVQQQWSVDDLGAKQRRFGRERTSDVDGNRGQRSEARGIFGAQSASGARSSVGGWRLAAPRRRRRWLRPYLLLLVTSRRRGQHESGKLAGLGGAHFRFYFSILRR